MTRRLTVPIRKAAVEEFADLNTFGVCLAENVDGTGMRIEFQRALTFDEQDRELGMDTYCICLSSGETHYGGVVRYGIVGELLTVEMTRGAADVLGFDNIALRLELSADEIAHVAAGVDRVLRADLNHP